jgi:hypothetical protein
VPAEPHTKLLTAAARESLRPLGLRQKGRSRTWLDDHGWWVGVVEFQSSAWSKGSYLNVGGMWLWDEQGHHVRFDVGHRVDGAGFIEYESDEQFAPEARRFSALAADEVRRLRATLRDLDSAITWLRDHSEGGQGWPDYNLGIALGLAGEHAEAAQCLRRLSHEPGDPDWWQQAVTRARELADLLENDVSAFRTQMQSAITAFRVALKLEPDVPGAIPQ